MKTPTCFLIDNDDDDRDFFKDALSEVDMSFTFLAARDGEEGFNALVSGNVLPQHIFLDLNMPKIHGGECLKQLRQVKHLNDIPIYIYTTADCCPQLIQQFIGDGAQKVLTKPSGMKDLINLLKTILCHVAV